MTRSSVTGSQLSDEEMTAVVLAVQLLRAPSPSPSVSASVDDTPSWRFSGRRFSGRRFSGRRFSNQRNFD